MAWFRILHPTGSTGTDRFSILARIFLFLFVLFLSSLVFLLLGNLILLFGWNMNLFTETVSEEWLMQPENSNRMLVVQCIQHIGTFIIPPLIYALLVNHRPFSFLSLNLTPSITLCLIGGLIMLISLPFINWLADVNSKLSLPVWMDALETWMKESEEKTQKLAETLIRAGTLNRLIINVIVIAIIPAAGEELVFRGIIQRHFLKMTERPWTAIIVTAFLFSALHLQFMTFLPRFFLGIILGYVFYRTNNLWISIFAHFTNNAFGVVIYYLLDNGMLPEGRFNPDTLGTGNDQSWIIAASFLSCVMILLLFRKVNHLLKTQNTVQ